MIVIDSSVWIAHLRNLATRGVQTFRSLERLDQVLVGDLVLTEVLQGARSEEHATRIEAALNQFETTAMVNPILAVRSARNYRLLRSRGVTIRKTVDLLIGTFCIEADHALLHDDRDFDPMAEHLGLRVL